MKQNKKQSKKKKFPSMLMLNKLMAQNLCIYGSPFHLASAQSLWPWG